MIKISYLRFAQFYQILKLYKIINFLVDIPSQPVISQCSTLLANAASFVDYYLQPIISENVYSYIQDTFYFRDAITKLGQLSEHTRLFTCDPISAFTCIDITHARFIFSK